MPQKPGRYGIKLYAVADAITYYCYNAEIHISRQNDGPFEVSYQPKDIVLRLCSSLFNTGRTVTTDNFYTSFELANELRERCLNLLGTVRINKRFIPPSFVQTNKFQPSEEGGLPGAIFGFNETATLTCFMPKLKTKKRVIPLLSTLPEHNNSEMDEGKLALVKDYNKTKGASTFWIASKQIMI